MRLKEVQCYIEDVQYKDYWDDYNNNPYNNAIIIIVRNAETNEIYSGAWSEQDIRNFCGIDGKINSRQMIDIATFLRNDGGLYRLLIPEDEKDVVITPELLLLGENKEEQQDINETDTNTLDKNEFLNKRRVKK